MRTDDAPLVVIGSLLLALLFILVMVGIGALFIVLALQKPAPACLLRYLACGLGVALLLAGLYLLAVTSLALLEWLRVFWAARWLG